MESRTYKDNFRNLILDMVQQELENYVSQRGAKKYFETNVDKVIDENIKKIRTRKDNENLYLKILTYGSYQDNIVSIGKLIKKQELFKSKQQIYNFARYLNLNVNKKLSYNQMLKIISKYIYDNRDLYSSKYVIYKRANNEYVVEPNVVKEDLIKSYKSKTREEMQTIAKLLDVDINENEGAEDIRKKIINNIIKDISESMATEVKVINDNIEFSSITKDKLKTIKDKNEATLTSVKNINKIIDIQGNKIDKIGRFIDDIEIVSTAISDSTKKVAAASEEQLNSIINISTSASALADMNSNLKGHIDSFAKDYTIDDKTNQYINNGLEILISLSKNDILWDMDYNSATKILKEKIAEYPYFDLFALMQKDGLRKAITLDYTENEVYVNFSHRPYFKEAIEGKFFKSEPYISVDTNNYCIAISVPVLNSQKQIVGILMGDLILG